MSAEPSGPKIFRLTATPDEETVRRLDIIRRWLERRTGRRVPVARLLDCALRVWVRRYTGGQAVIRVRNRTRLLEEFKSE